MKRERERKPLIKVGIHERKRERKCVSNCMLL